MKKTLLFRLLWFGIVLSSFISCQKGFGEDEPSDKSTHSLTIKTRSIDNTPINYPLYLYAFSSNGNCVARQTVNNDEQSIDMELAVGNYKFVAFAGCAEEFSLPDNPKLTDKITLDNLQGASDALMMGRADVPITSGDSYLEISLSYVVSAYSVALKGISSDISAVSLILSPLYGSIDMAGNYTDEGAKLEIPCQLDTENIWGADLIYAFPGSSENTSFSIVITKADGTQKTYAYTYDGTPEANHAFNIGGNYIGGITIGGEFVVRGWDTPIDVDFDFGAGMEVPPTEDDNNPQQPGNDNSQGLIQVGNIWNDGIVVSISDGKVLLMHLEEWSCYPIELSSLLDMHAGDGWNVPFEEEARLMNKAFQGETLYILNDILQDKGYTPLSESKRYFYIQDDYIYAFGFKSSSRFQAAGEKTKYLLRMVKTVTL